jgi:hypothetical protein
MQNGRLFEVSTMNEVGATPKPRKQFFFEQSRGADGAVDERTQGGAHE